MDTTQRSVREEIARRMLRTTRIGPTAVARYVDLPRDEVVQLAIEVRGGCSVSPSPPAQSLIFVPNPRARSAMRSGLLTVFCTHFPVPGKISSTIARPSSTRKRTSSPANPKPYTLCGSS